MGLKAIAARGPWLEEKANDPTRGILNQELLLSLALPSLSPKPPFFFP